MKDNKTIKLNKSIYNAVECLLDKKSKKILYSAINNNFKITKKWKVTKSIKPFYNKKSEILFVGTSPSKSSFNRGFYYLSDNNHFWTLINNAITKKGNKRKLFNKNNKKSLKNKLRKYRIALSDSIDICIRKSGSLDNDIIIYKPNQEILNIVKNSNIATIFCTSKNAWKILKEQLNINKIPKNHIINRYNKNIYIKCLSSPSNTAWLKKTKKDRNIIEKEWKNEIKSRINFLS